MKYNLTFRKMEMIETVAKTQSVTIAAEYLSLTQPALTQALKSVERELGLTLFIRGARGLEPTVYVEPFLRHIAAIRNEIQAAKDELAGKANQPSRRLRVQSGPRAAELWLDPAIETMIADDNSLIIHKSDAVSSMYENLIGQHVDLAIAPAGVFPKHSSLVFRPFAVIQNRIIVREGHPLTSLIGPSFSDLKAYPLVEEVVPKNLEAKFRDGFGKFAVRNEQTGGLIGAIPESNLDTILSIVKTSDAIGFMPEQLFESRQKEGLEILKNDRFCQLPELPVAIAFHKNSETNPDMFTFIKHLRSVIFRQQNFFIA